MVFGYRASVHIVVLNICGYQSNLTGKCFKKKRGCERNLYLLFISPLNIYRFRRFIFCSKNISLKCSNIFHVNWYNSFKHFVRENMNCVYFLFERISSLSHRYFHEIFNEFIFMNYIIYNFIVA